MLQPIDREEELKGRIKGLEEKIENLLMIISEHIIKEHDGELRVNVTSAYHRAKEKGLKVSMHMDDFTDEYVIKVEEIPEGVDTTPSQV